MKKTYALAFASSLFLLGSCASDAPIAENGTIPTPEEGDGYYVRLEFNGNETTRAAGDFTTAINSAAFAFFTADGEHIATRRIGGEYATEADADIIDWVEPTAGDHSAATKCAVLKLSSVPAYVQCLINAPKDHTQITADLGDYDEDTFYYEATDNNYITMSNATYYTANSAQGKVVYSTTIDPAKHLFTKKSDAVNVSIAGKEGVKIYVEPIMAKVLVTKDAAITSTINNADNGEVNATVTFKPEYAFLTAWNNKANTVKSLPEFADLRDALKTWSGVNSVNGHFSGWVGDCAGTQVWATLKDVKAGTGYDYLPGTPNTSRYNFTGTQVFYPFENKDIETRAKRTAIVVCGKYTAFNGATDLSYTAADKAADEAYNAVEANTKKRKIETVGTFYLVGVGEKFEVYKRESEAIAAVGGVEGDELVPEGVTNAAVTPQTNYIPWTGKLVVKGKTYLPKVIKYNGGYGYYSRTINRTTIGETNYPAIVRNTEYTLNIKGIKGMGVGIPTEDTPIIPVTPPNPKDEDMYLHLAVIVNPWVKVSQDVSWE